VAIGEDCTEEPVRKFGPFTSDLHRMADWLTEHHVETVVMESTGVYWIPVFQISGGERIRGKIGQRRSCEESARAQE
jgi:hypothetical protein